MTQSEMSPQAQRLEIMANMLGAIAADEMVKFEDNPYLNSEKYAWLYSAWNYGYINSEDFLGK